MLPSPPLHPLRIVRAEMAATATASDHWPPAMRLEIAFAGRSNVGKSSLLNALVGQHRLARTSSTPGCTRKLAFFDVETADHATATLVDLPGYGFAQRSKAERNEWGKLIEDYLIDRPTLRAVVVLFDVRRGLEEEETNLLKLLAETTKGKRPAPAALLVATKLDLIGLAQRKVRMSQLHRELPHPVIATAMDDPKTITHLWTTIRRSVGLSPPLQGT